MSQDISNKQLLAEILKGNKELKSELQAVEVKLALIIEEINHRLSKAEKENEELKNKIPRLQIHQHVDGVTLTDINETNGKKALEEIENEFGKGKAIFIQCDVTKMEEIQSAFESTLEKFGSIDILINNAGILDDLNWEREIAINLNGTINGILLGFERYLKNYKQGEEAVILNTASLAGIVQYGVAPIYSGTKSAIIGLTRSWAHPMHYQRTKVRVMAIVPGRTRTTSFELRDFLLDPVYMDMYQKREQRKLQRPEFVSNELIKILENGRNGSLWVIEKEEPAYEFLVPTKEELKRHHINC